MFVIKSLPEKFNIKQTVISPRSTEGNILKDGVFTVIIIQQGITTIEVLVGPCNFM
jgi:hypothetical protein